MRDRHFPRLCRSCQAPLARQQDDCWHCDAPCATDGEPSSAATESRHAAARWADEGGSVGADRHDRLTAVPEGRPAVAGTRR